MVETTVSLSWILSLARASFHSQMGDLTYRSLVDRLWREMEKAQVPGIVRAPSHEQSWRQSAFDLQQAAPRVHELTVEAYFYLIRNGYAVEKPTGDPNRPFSLEYRWTERGRQWISGADPVPENAGEYLGFLQEHVSPLDPVIEQYVREALSAFERQAHFAAAVMLGAASEKALYLLAESLLRSISDVNQKKKLQELYDYRGLYRLFEFIRKTVLATAKEKAWHHSVSEGAEAHLMSIFDAIRVQRNDAVHPMNASVSETSVRVLLVAFPYTLQRMEALRAWFLANQVNFPV